MKLSKLYANKKFKNIVFNDGLNLVLAKVTKALDINKDSHCLGKSTLIEVIDFLMLAEAGKDSLFIKHKDKFSGYEFYLELKLNTGSFLTIKRAVQNASKISFKLTGQTANLLDKQEWDYSGVSFETAKNLLNEYLNFDALPSDWTYRKSLTYFLRSQQDYSDVFQLNKFKGKHKDWKPFVFDLLGFYGQLLKNKYEYEDRIINLNTDIERIKRNNSVDPKEVDRIKGAIELIAEEKRILQKQIDNFNFYQQERNLNKELVEEIEKKISELNTCEYNLKYDLERTRNSVAQNTTFDIDQLKQLYSEAGIFFTGQLVKGYKELEDFNKKITEERNKYLKEKIVDLTNELEKIRATLHEYDQKRSDILSVLQDKDSFRKFKTYQDDLQRIERDALRLDMKLKGINEILGLTDQKDEIKSNLDTITKEIKEQIAKGNSIYYEIRKFFNNIFKHIVNTPAMLFIEPNKQGNVEYKAEVTTENQSYRTAEGHGSTYKKMLCASFDLAVLAAYSKKSFYRFVYHDGIFEGLDNRKKANFIELIRKYCTENNIQYIFSSIEHDLPEDLLAGISNEEICLKLDDSGDSGKLFEFSF